MLLRDGFHGIEPWINFPGGPALPLIPTVDKGTAGRGQSGLFGKPRQSVEKRGMEGRSRLDFHGCNVGTSLQNQIDFMAAVISPEIYPGSPATVVFGLYLFTDDVILEYGTAQVVPGQVFSPPYAQNRAEQAGIIKIQLGLFHHAFVPVLVIGPQQINNETGLQNGNP
jgi:hypothetical protein